MACWLVHISAREVNWLTPWAWPARGECPQAKPQLFWFEFCMYQKGHGEVAPYIRWWPSRKCFTVSYLMVWSPRKWSQGSPDHSAVSSETVLTLSEIWFVRTVENNVNLLSCTRRKFPSHTHNRSRMFKSVPVFFLDPTLWSGIKSRGLFLVLVIVPHNKGSWGQLLACVAQLGRGYSVGK